MRLQHREVVVDSGVEYGPLTVTRCQVGVRQGHGEYGRIQGILFGNKRPLSRELLEVSRGFLGILRDGIC